VRGIEQGPSAIALAAVDTNGIVYVTAAGGRRAALACDYSSVLIDDEIMCISFDVPVPKLAPAALPVLNLLRPTRRHIRSTSAFAASLRPPAGAGRIPGARLFKREDHEFVERLRKRPIPPPASQG